MLKRGNAYGSTLDPSLGSFRIYIYIVQFLSVTSTLARSRQSQEHPILWYPRHCLQSQVSQILRILNATLDVHPLPLETALRTCPGMPV